MSNTKQTILTPVGRIVAGNLYKGSDKDAEGKPRTVKTGPNAGQAAVQFYFALAIPKRAGVQWWQEEWGAKIYAVGAAAFPQACQSPAFAWKVKDGDSTIPNRKGKRPCDQEGYPGHWVLSFASGFPPKIFNKDGTEQILQPDAVKPGYFVQVYGTVDGNGSQQQPGIFLNHSMVAFVAYGDEIISGPDATAVGFGQNVTLPPGASAAPLAGSFAPGSMPPGAAPGVPAAMPGTPAMPGAAPSVPGAAPMAMPGMPAMPGSAPAMPQMAAPPTVVQPHPQFLAPAVPGVPGAPAAPAAPAAPVRQMTAAAQGVRYEDYIAKGWTDALLVQHGLMTA